ncbi:SDR family NAD(P)-dependent oxidoreductase [Streptomyces aureoversilis]|uniref:SDR family NAD(P)-dependent oxidoreductase n=1 Tax=Streptomyces aureoversilis TaxID=67277 RepID=A0ABW0A9V1_9ACTN
MPDEPLPRRVPVAVVGLGALLPDARDVEQGWRLILGRRNLMQDIPPTRWLIDDHYHPIPGTPRRLYTYRGAFLPTVDFDPMAYGILPQNLASTDTAQLLALLVAEQVLRDAADGGVARPDGDRVAVVLGSAALALLAESNAPTQRPVWLKALREHGLPEAEAHAVCDRIIAHYPPPTEATFPGLLSNVVAGRIAARFDLHGTNHTTDAACAGSFAALSTALDELSLGRADLVISGGVDATNDIGMFCCFTTTPALSPTQECRPFAEDADGTMLGEAVVMFALKRLADAERDGDGVYAVIRGLGSSSDGRGTAIYTPRAGGQALALRRAYEEAGYEPATVELVEAHGTGTKAGDQAEFTALREVFAPSGRAGRQWCALGSVKSQIGHTKSAAGAAGLLKAVLALHHKVLPPTINADRPHPGLRMETSPFYLNTLTRPWIRAGDTPRRASVSSFGFGGSNFHVTLEEHRAPTSNPTSNPNPAPASTPAPSRTPAGSRPRLRTAPTELLLLCADSAEELRERVADLRRAAQEAGARPAHRLADLARRTQEEFRPDAARRLALLATDTARLVERLDQAAAGLDAGEALSRPLALHWGAGPPEPGRLAWLFPGQGAQYVGMGGDLAAHHPGALAVWDAVGGTGPEGTGSEGTGPEGADPDGAGPGGAGSGGVPLHRVVFPPTLPDDRRAAQQELLTATEWAQPALAAHSLALLAVLEEFGLRPDAVAGHSLGELVALHAAGVYDGDTLMRLSRVRGEAMRDAGAATPGAMLVVLADPSEVRDALTQSGAEEVWIANHNGPRQTVVSGTPEAIARVAARMKAAGTVTVPLVTSAAFHSPLVAAARAPFAAALAAATLSPPGPEVFSNTDAAPYPSAAEEIRARLTGHLTEPVRFTEQIEAMYRAGVRTFVEAGPGTTLTALVDRILGDRPHLAVPLERRGTHGVTAFQDALARFSVHGIPLDFAPYWQHYVPPRPAGQERAPRMTVKIDGGNYGRRYPPQDAARGATERQKTADEPAPGSAQPTGPGTVLPPAPFAPPVPPPSAASPAVPAPPAEPGAAPVLPGVFALPEPPALPGVPAPAVTQHGPEPVPAAFPVPPAASPSASPPPPPPAGEDDARIALIEDAQRQTADAHAVFLRSMSEAHQAFLRMSETSFAALVGTAPGESAAPPPEGSTGMPGMPGGPEASPVPPPAARPDSTSAPLSAAPVLASSPAVPQTVEAATLPTPAEFDPARLEQELLAVVAERTGYPLEMLDLDMELESELGIDSIKRVEILSVLRQRMGELPEMQGDPTELVSLRTLRQVVGKIREVTGGTAAVAGAPELGPGPAEAPALPPGPSGPATAPEPARAPALVGRYALRTVPAPPTGLAVPGLGKHVLHVVDGGSGLAALVAGRLAGRGVPAEPVPEPLPESRAVLLLGGLAEDLTVDAMVEVQRDAFRAARTVAPRFAEEGGVFVTVQDTGGDFGAGGAQGERAWLGGLAGLVRTLAGEWPQAVVKAVDCARSGRSPGAVADAVVGELLHGGPLLEVGLPADGSRVTGVAVPAPPGAEDGGPGPDDVIVVTGGARGVTAAAVTALARSRRPRLALLGRTEPADEPPGLPPGKDEPALVRALAAQRPGAAPAGLAQEARRILAVREIRATLSAIEEAGAPVRYIPADTRDPEAVRTALHAVRTAWGPVTGIVHGAGVLADKRIADKTDRQFDDVFGTKVSGLRVLLDATADDPLRTLCLFSSVAGCFGNPGQSDYAMANETLHQVAAGEAAARPGCRVRALAWGPWQGGMVTPALADHFTAAGVPLLDPPAGAQAFVEELTRPGEDDRVLLVAVPAGARAQRELPAVLPPPGMRRLQAAGARVTPATHPYLAHHVIRGRAVLPLAQSLEWILAAARAWNPAAAALTLRDIRVLLPAYWEATDTQGKEFTLHGTNGTSDPGSLTVELRGAGGRVHCRALAAADDGPAGAVPPVPAETEVPALPPWERGEIYDGDVLFHGPLLHALTSVEGMGPAGARGTLAGSAALGWPGDTWQTDLAALDGALQLAVLWAPEVLGEAALPMSVGTFRLHHRARAQGPVTCTLQAVRAEDNAAWCHLRLAGEDGTPFADLFDVGLIRRPDRLPGPRPDGPLTPDNSPKAEGPPTPDGSPTPEGSPSEEGRDTGGL